MKQRKPPLQPLQETIHRMTGRLLDDAGVRQGVAIWRHWAKAVGPQVARHTEPAVLRDGVLTVRVDSAAWMAQLTFLKPELLVRLGQWLPAGALRDLRFKQATLRGGVGEGRREARVPLAPATPEEQERTREWVAGIADPPLRESVYRLLLRAQVSNRTQ